MAFGFVTGLQPRESLPAARHGVTDMVKAAPKIVLSGARDIPLDLIDLSQSNVRRVKAGVSIEALADDIARRGIRSEEHTSELQSLMRSSYAVFCLTKKKKQHI